MTIKHDDEQTKQVLTDLLAEYDHGIDQLGAGGHLGSAQVKLAKNTGKTIVEFLAARLNERGYKLTK